MLLGSYHTARTGQSEPCDCFFVRKLPLIHHVHPHQSASAPKSCFAVYRYIPFSLTEMNELVDNGSGGSGSINEVVVMVLETVIGESFLIVEFLVHTENAIDFVLLEHWHVILWCERRVTIRASSGGVRARKRDEFILDHDGEITVFNTLKVFILFDIERTLEVEEVHSLGALDRSYAMKRREPKCNRSSSSITEGHIRFVDGEGSVGLRRSLSKIQYRVSTNKDSSIGAELQTGSTVEVNDLPSFFGNLHFGVHCLAKSVQTSQVQRTKVTKERLIQQYIIDCKKVCS